jgi:hypothetical protein
MTGLDHHPPRVIGDDDMPHDHHFDRNEFAKMRRRVSIQGALNSLTTFARSFFGNTLSTTESLTGLHMASS